MWAVCMFIPDKLKARFFAAAEKMKPFFVILQQHVLKTVLTKDVWKLDSRGDERISLSFIFHCHPYFLERWRVSKYATHEKCKGL